MDALPDFRVVNPRTLDDVIAARAANPNSMPLGGGTDLVVNIRRGIVAPKVLIDMNRVQELHAIRSDEKGLELGASVRLSEIAEHPGIGRSYPVLAQAAAHIAGPTHRNMGTVGGNLCLDTRCIFYNQSEWWRRSNGFCLKRHGDVCHVAPQGQRCHAAFTGDLAPALLALGADAEIGGMRERRRIPLSDLYVEDGLAHLALRDDELLVAVHVPAAVPSTYSKVRVRGAIDYPLAGVAVALVAAAGVVQSLRIAVTGTNSQPFVLAGTDIVVGRPIDDRALQEIDRLVQKQVQPMRTTVASGHYRRLAAAALARRLAAALFAEQQGRT